MEGLRIPMTIMAVEAGFKATAACDFFGLLRIVPVRAPLEDVPGHIVKAEGIGLEGHDRRSRRIAVGVAGNHPVPVESFLGGDIGKIARARWGRPLRTPWIEIEQLPVFVVG